MSLRGANPRGNDTVVGTRLRRYEQIAKLKFDPYLLKILNSASDWPISAKHLDFFHFRKNPGAISPFMWFYYPDNPLLYN